MIEQFALRLKAQPDTNRAICNLADAKPAISILQLTSLQLPSLQLPSLQLPSLQFQSCNLNLCKAKTVQARPFPTR